MKFRDAAGDIWRAGVGGRDQRDVPRTQRARRASSSFKLQASSSSHPIVLIFHSGFHGLFFLVFLHTPLSIHSYSTIHFYFQFLTLCPNFCLLLLDDEQDSFILVPEFPELLGI
jgi:hypothetical protein